MKALNDDKQTINTPTVHGDFSICLHCLPCGNSCAFLQNNVKFILDNNRKRILGIKFDTSLNTCNGECGEMCISHFRLAEALRNKHTKHTII